MHAKSEEPKLYGLMAEFAGPEELLEATRRAYAVGYRRMEAYAPFPIEDLPEALGAKGTRIPLIVFCAGVLGATSAYFLQYWTSKIDYPINVGGRPYNSFVAFIPVTFELTILFAGLTALVAMVILNGLPMPYHPVFNVPAFVRASQDRFFLCIESTDPLFDPRRTTEFLNSVKAAAVEEVTP